jgi:hypothetical protein
MRETVRLGGKQNIYLSLSVIRWYEAGVEVMLHSFLTLALDVGEWPAERTLVATEQEVQGFREYSQPGRFGEKSVLLPGIEALDSPAHGLVTMLSKLPWLQS